MALRSKDKERLTAVADVIDENIASIFVAQEQMRQLTDPRSIQNVQAEIATAIGNISNESAELRAAIAAASETNRKPKGSDTHGDDN